MKKNRFLSMILALLLPILVVADESATKNHGPRAGKIIGAGPVLAEVVWWGAEKLEIYFLNEAWVDVLDKGISIKVEIVHAQTPARDSVSCRESSPGFSCVIAEPKTIKPGDKLQIVRLKNGSEPKTFEYFFPSPGN